MSKIDVRKLAKQVDMTDQKVSDLAQCTEGYLSEIGQQAFGIHIVQEMICEKLEITPAMVEERINARKAALEEQYKLQQEKAAAGHEAAQAEKERIAQERAAESPEQPEVTANGDADETTAQGTDQSN